MKYLTIFIFTCSVFIVKWASSQRRVLNGFKVHSNKPYMVYLVKHQWSHALYDGWLCGGAIIHPLHILTSAACVKDVYNIIVISGLSEYTIKAHMDDNQCTRKTRRKIVALCEFKNDEYNVTDFYTYNTSSDNGSPHATSWALGNLGLARIDSPFAFHSNDYTAYCDYKPEIVSVNFLKKYEKPGTQAVVLGWGNRRFYRPRGDHTNYNERYLHYTSAVIVNKSQCIEKYAKSNLKLLETDQTLLCTDGQGILNDYGLPYDYDDICFNCEETTTVAERRWYMGSSTRTRRSTVNWLSTYGNGPCQNDQGGPLVAWIGGRETVIGVASAFMVTTKMECKGPFIFASTACSSQLIYCIMTTKLRRSAEYCNNIAQRSGVKIYQTFLSWNDTGFSMDEKGKRGNRNGPATVSGYYGMNNEFHVPEPSNTLQKLTRTTKKHNQQTPHLRSEEFISQQPRHSDIRLRLKRRDATKTPTKITIASTGANTKAITMQNRKEKEILTTRTATFVKSITTPITGSEERSAYSAMNNDDYGVVNQQHAKDPNDMDMHYYGEDTNNAAYGFPDNTYRKLHPNNRNIKNKTMTNSTTTIHKYDEVSEVKATRFEMAEQKKTSDVTISNNKTDKITIGTTKSVAKPLTNTNV